MNADVRQRLVRRLDILFFAGLLISSGLAAVLFWTQFYDNEGAGAVAVNPTATVTAAPTRTAAATHTPSATLTASATATYVPTETPTVTPTATGTPTQTATVTAAPSSTPSITPSPTPSQTLTPTLTSSPDLTGTALSVFYLTQVALAALPSATPMLTPTPSITPSPTQTISPTETLTLTATPWPTPQVVALALAQTYAGEPLLMTGSAQPGDTIQLMDQGQVIAFAAADESGTWVLELPEGLPEGPHSLSVVAVSAGGTASQPVPVGFQVGSAPTPTPSASPTATLTFTPTPTASSTPTSSPSRTPSPTPLPPTATFSPIPPTATGTATGTAMPVPTNTATLLPTTAVPTATLTATRTPETAALEPTRTHAPAPTASETPTPSPPVRPRIDTPVNGAVFSPGRLTVSGVAEPGTMIEVRDTDTGAARAAVEVSSDGAWQTEVELAGEGQVTLVAAALGPDGVPAVSDPVTITLAPSVQPVSGGAQQADPGETGRAFTALLALLLAAGGFSTYFAGRLIYLLAHDRLKPR